MHLPYLLINTAFLAQAVWTIGTNDQVEPDIDYGTFQDPSSNVRPRFRYWVNDASLNLSVVAEDVKAMGESGAGGLELLGYYLYGDTLNYGAQMQCPLQSDWTIFGFGSPAWSKFINAMFGGDNANISARESGRHRLGDSKEIRLTRGLGNGTKPRRRCPSAI